MSRWVQGQFEGQEADIEDGLPDYVQTLLDGVDLYVPLEARRSLIDLWQGYARLFSLGDGDLVRVTSIKHRIDTTGSRPFRKV